MTNVKLTMSINKTHGTVIGSMLFISLLVVGDNYAAINTNCLTNRGQDVIQSNVAQKCKLTQGRGISYSLSGYNVDENHYVETENISISTEKVYNLKKIEQIAKLEKGWDGDEANAFEEDLLTIARNIIITSEIQPDVFPTVCDSIQFEYERPDGSYLEIELSLNNEWNVFEINSIGKEQYFTINSEIEALNKVVSSFYG